MYLAHFQRNATMNIFLGSNFKNQPIPLQLICFCQGIYLHLICFYQGKTLRYEP